MFRKYKIYMRSQNACARTSIFIHAVPGFLGSVSCYCEAIDSG